MISKNLILTIYTKESGVNETVLDIRTTDDNNTIVLESKAPKIALAKEQLKEALDEVEKFLSLYPRSKNITINHSFDELLNNSDNINDEGL